MDAHGQQDLQHPEEQGTPKSFKIASATDVAARYSSTSYTVTYGQPEVWGTLRGMGETRATVERAIERGWSP